MSDESEIDSASGLLPSDAKQLVRFLTRSLNNGFAAAAIKLTRPPQRDRLVAWIKDLPGLETARIIETDVSELPGNNLWNELGERWLAPAADGPQIAIIYGLEQTREPDNSWPSLRQLNVQRDVLARDFPWPWVLLLHPEVARQLRLEAPDFSDYLGLWLEVPEPATTPLHAFLRSLLDSTCHIDIQGIGTRHSQGETALSYPIEVLYTPLRTRVAPGLAESINPLVPNQATEQLVDLRQVVLQHQRVLIEGQPGAGKTTFLRLIASMLARDALDIPGPGGKRWSSKYLGLSIEASQAIPLYLQASNLVRHLTELSSKGTYDRGRLIQLIERVCCVDSPAFEQGEWARLLETGEAWLLLDGVDEVASGELRLRLIEMLRDASRHWKARFLVSSRPIETERIAALGFCVVTVEPLRGEEIVAFVSRWVDGLRASTNVAMSLRRLERHRDELLVALLQNPLIRRLAETPLMLTCLCVVHFNAGKLPEGRSGLYHAVIEWMVRSRSERRKAAGYSDEFALRALARLALRMMTTGKGKVSMVSFAEAAQLSRADLERQFPDDGRDKLQQIGESWLQFECEASGIIQELPGRQLRFWHLTFQEYLAALSLSWQVAAGDAWWTDLVSQHLEDAQWRETIEFLPGCLFDGPGLDSVDELLDRVVKLLGARDDLSSQAKLAAVLARLLLALKAYEYEAPEGVQRAYERALDRSLAIVTIEGAQQVPVKIRIEVAEALGRDGHPRLTPDKDNFIPVPGTRISLGKYPVTVEEYRHFVDARGYALSKFWSTKGWAAKSQERWLAPGEWGNQLQAPNRPVVNVSWYEAEAYCAWLSDERGKEIRLPTEVEWHAAAKAVLGEYPWGETELNEELANFASQTSGDGRHEPMEDGLNLDGYYQAPNPRVGHPTPVGIYPSGAGPYGHLDLAGNVWEWTLTTAEQGSAYLICGGSWGHPASDCRSAARRWGRSDVRLQDIGFRLAAAQASAHEIRPLPS